MEKKALVFIVSALLIGGIIGYVGVKDRDQDMANGLLIFGVIWSLIGGVISWIIYMTMLQSMVSLYFPVTHAPFW